MSVPFTEARDQLSELVNRVAYGGDRIRITRRGRNIAGLVSNRDLAWLEEQRMLAIPVTNLKVKRRPPNIDKAEREVTALLFEDYKLAGVVVLEESGRAGVTPGRAAVTPAIWRIVDDLEFERGGVDA